LIIGWTWGGDWKTKKDLKKVFNNFKNLIYLFYNLLMFYNSFYGVIEQLAIINI